MKPASLLSKMASSELATRLRQPEPGESELRDLYRSFVNAEDFSAEDRRFALDLDGDETGDLNRNFLLVCVLLLLAAAALAFWAGLAGAGEAVTPPADTARSFAASARLS
jgi:hypothetical protein